MILPREGSINIPFGDSLGHVLLFGNVVVVCICIVVGCRCYVVIVLAFLVANVTFPMKEPEADPVLMD